uniref:Major facilitator superfamily (MFS) profile domain-containing protein n=1 Tax=Anopheles christyi TaxID=43041 RepID=A0A182JVW4_9DIPT
MSSDETPLTTGKITNEQQGTVGSIGTIGCMLAPLVCGWVSEIAGRKSALMLIGVTQLVSWAVMPFATNLSVIYASRIFGGFAGGGTLSIVPLFVSEISEDRIRGTLGTMLAISCNFGILLGFIISHYVNCWAVTYLALLLCVVYSLGCCFLPESPQYLFVKKKKEKAIKALRFYRGEEAESETSQFTAEVARFKDIHNVGTLKKKDSNQIHIKDFLTRSHWKPILICVIVIMFPAGSGSIPLITYTAKIFQESHSNLSPAMSSIVVATLQLIGSYVSTMTVEKAGRRVLLVVSTLGCAVCTITMGTYTFLQEMRVEVDWFRWVPVASMSALVFINAIGIGIVPFIIMTEILDPKIRGSVVTFCLLEFSGVAYLVVKYFPIAVEQLGMHSCMWFFSCCCVASATFVLTCMPETKGKNFEQISESLNGGKKAGHKDVAPTPIIGVVKLSMFLEFLSRRYWKQFTAIAAGSIPVCVISSLDTRQNARCAYGGGRVPGRVHIITASYGVTVGWPAPIIPLLRSPETPLPSGPVTVEEASWIGSTLCIGGTIGTILFAIIHTYFGKKIALLLMSVPQLILWTLILFGDNVWYIYGARFCSGLTGGGVVSVVPLYIADIADKKIRGTLGSLTIIFINIGLVFIYAAGNYLPYDVIPKIMLVAPVGFIVLVSFLPETPYCLLRKGRQFEAERSLMFYRNIPDERQQTPEFTTEFDELKSFVHTQSTQSPICWADFTTSEAKRGLFIGVFVMALNQFSGIFAILTYAGTILQMSGTGIDPNVALIIVAVLNICGNLTSFAIIDRVGRKILLLLSATGVGLALAVLGAHSYLLTIGYDLQGVEWLPVLALSLTLFLGAIGITNIPFFIVPEVMPPKLRSIGSTISGTLLCMFAFGTVKLYPIMMVSIHIYGTVWISSGVNKKIRGILGSFLALTSNGGILFMYVIGDLLSYHTVALTMLGLPLLFTVLMSFVPDTPQTCLKMGQAIEAERSFMFYRGIKTQAEKTSALRQEFDNMEKFIEHNNGQGSRVTCSDFKSREARLGIFIGVFLMFINQFCGIFAILTYAASIFAGVGSTLSPNTSAIIMGTIQIVGTLSSFVFVDLAGRKVLLIISTLGTGLGLFLLAVFNWLTVNGSVDWLQDYSWFPIVSLSATVYLFSIVANQFLGTLIANLIALAHGITLGWVSPSLEYLRSNETHLVGGPVTVEETSWLGSSLCIGGMIGVTLYGSLADRIGKRRAMQIIAIPHVAFWLCVIFGNSVLQLCIGRVLAGVAGGGIIRIVPLFVADIADPRIRGMLGSLLPVCFNFGTVLAFILSTLVSFATFPLVVLVLPALFTLAVIFLPETPPCLLRAYRNERAERSLMFYRGVRGHFAKSESFRNEFQQLKYVIERERTAPDAALSWKDFGEFNLQNGMRRANVSYICTL